MTKPLIFRDPMAHSLKEDQLFDVTMDHVAGLGSLVSPHRDRRLRNLSRPKPMASRVRPTVVSGAATILVIRLRVKR